MAGFQEHQFVGTADAFKKRLEREASLRSQRQNALKVLGEAAVQLVAFSRSAVEEGPLLTARLSDQSVEVIGGNRHLVFASVEGVGLDTDLKGARNDLCAQIFVYSFLSSQDNASLVSSLRIYKDGDVTDGEVLWSIEDGAEACLPFLSSLIKDRVFECEMFWPEPARLSSELRSIAVKDNRIDVGVLEKNCADF